MTTKCGILQLLLMTSRRLSITRSYGIHCRSPYQGTIVRPLFVWLLMSLFLDFWHFFLLIRYKKLPAFISTRLYSENLQLNLNINHITNIMWRLLQQQQKREKKTKSWFHNSCNWLRFHVAKSCGCIWYAMVWIWYAQGTVGFTLHKLDFQQSARHSGSRATCSMHHSQTVRAAWLTVPMNGTAFMLCNIVKYNKICKNYLK